MRMETCLLGELQGIWSHKPLTSVKCTNICCTEACVSNVVVLEQHVVGVASNGKMWAL